MTDTSGKEIVRIFCIYYPVWFQGGQRQENQIKVLLDSGSKINAMNLVFTQKLGFYIQKTNVKAQKIDSSALEIFEMIIADLEMENKASRSKFFQKIFLVADTKFEAVLEILFLKISNADVSFDEKTLM